MTDTSKESSTPRRNALAQFDELFVESETDHPTVEEVTFEQRAIGNVVNPLEQIDSAFKRTGSRLWLGVAGVFLLVAALVTWGFIAQRVVTTDASIVILPQSGLFPVGTIETGMIGEVLVKEGASVTVGQKLTTVTDPTVGELSIVSPIDGIVVSVDAARGQITGPWTSMFLLAPKGEPAIAIGLVGPSQLGGLQEGLPVTIAIPTVNPQSYGRLVGTLDSVSATPVTRSRISAVLGDEAQATALIQQGPTYEVQIKLARSSTPSGYQWTVGDGPPTALPLSTHGVAFIETSRESIASGMFG